MNPLSFAVYTVRGKDAGAFLQGQLTCDMREVDAAHWRFAAYCTPQGKVLATVWVFGTQDGHYGLVLPKELAEKTIARLTMFILRSDVQIVADARSCYAVTSAIAAMERRETEAGACVLHGMAGVALHIAAQAPPQALAAETFAVACMRAGLAWIHAATADEFLPQMLALADIGGLSFHKGCYVGQEVVARMQYKGSNRRLLAVGHGTPTVLPQAGDALLAGGQRAGTVLQAVEADGLAWVQAVIQDRFLALPLSTAADISPLSFLLSESLHGKI